MLTCGHLPPLPENNHGPPNRSTILPAPLPMVRPPLPADLGPRPTFHLSLRASAHQGVRDLLEPVNGVPPPDRRVNRTEEPVGRTVPQAPIDQSARLGRDASFGHADPQQRPEFDHRPRPKPPAPRARTRSNPRSKFNLRQSRSKGTCRPVKATEEASNRSA